MLVLISKYLYKNGGLKKTAEYCFKRDITDKLNIKNKDRRKSRSAAYWIIIIEAILCFVNILVKESLHWLVLIINYADVQMLKWFQ